jgi:hypothetical protein
LAFPVLTKVFVGSIASITLIGAPVAQSFPETTAQMWHGMFIRGMAVMPKVAITVGLSYAYAAYEARDRGGYWKGFLSAAGLVVAIIPFTLLFMSSTNAALIHSARGPSTLTVAQESELVSKWGLLNLIRSFLPLTGAVTGLVTLLDNLS